MERWRVVLLIIGALFDAPAPVLWVIAVLGNLMTMIHRLVFTFRKPSSRPTLLLLRAVITAASEPASSNRSRVSTISSIRWATRAGCRRKRARI